MYEGYTVYHANDWAYGKTTTQIAQEIERCEYEAMHHHFPWNSVGNAQDTWTRALTLRKILIDKGEELFNCIVLRTKVRIPATFERTIVSQATA